MATFDYAALASRAGDLLAKFGQAATLNRILSEDYDPVAGQSSNVSTLAFAVTVVVGKIDRDYALANAASIEDGDLMATMDGTTEPSLSDTLTIDGTNYAVIGVMELNPGGTALLYKLHIRGTSQVSVPVVNVIDGGDASSTATGSYDGGGA